MKRCALLFFLIPAIAGATDLTFEWDAPTERTNGDALAPEELKSYQLYQGGERVIVVPAPTSQAMIPNLSPGDYSFAVTAKDQNDLESAKSEILQIKIPTPTPTATATPTPITPPAMPPNFRLKEMHLVYGN